jgi:hypothetical protein
MAWATFCPQLILSPCHASETTLCQEEKSAVQAWKQKLLAARNKIKKLKQNKK